MERVLNDEEKLALMHERLREKAVIIEAFGNASTISGLAIQVVVPVGIILNVLVILALVKQIQSQNSQSNKIVFLRFSLSLSFSDLMMCMIFAYVYFINTEHLNVWGQHLSFISTFPQSFLNNTLNPNNTYPLDSSEFVFPHNVGQESISGGNTDIDFSASRTTTLPMFGQDNRNINERIDNIFSDIDVLNDSDVPLDHGLHDSNNSSALTDNSNTDIPNDSTDFIRPLSDKSNIGISNAITDSSRPFSFVNKQSSNFTFKFGEMISISDLKRTDNTEVSLTSKILSSVYVLPITASSLSMTGSAIVVMIKIVWPFYNIPKQYTMIAIITLWLVSSSVSACSFLYIFKDNRGIMREKIDKVQVYLFTFTCLTVVLIASIYLSVVVVAFNMCSRSVVERKRKKSKAMITISIIIGCYFVCYIPFLLNFIGTNRYANLPVELTVAGTVVPLLFVINTCIDPIVYSFRVLDIKPLITKIVTRFLS